MKVADLLRLLDKCKESDIVYLLEPIFIRNGRWGTTKRILKLTELLIEAAPVKG